MYLLFSSSSSSFFFPFLLNVCEYMYVCVCVYMVVKLLVSFFWSAWLPQRLWGNQGQIHFCSWPSAGQESDGSHQESQLGNLTDVWLYLLQIKWILFSCMTGTSLMLQKWSPLMAIVGVCVCTIGCWITGELYIFTKQLKRSHLLMIWNTPCFMKTMYFESSCRCTCTSPPLVVELPVTFFCCLVSLTTTKILRKARPNILL